MRLKFKDATGIHEFNANRQGEKLNFQYNDRSIELEVNELSNAEFMLTSGEEIIRCQAVRRKDMIFIHIGGRSLSFRDVTQEDDSVSGGAGGEVDSEVVAPMPGSVIKLLVTEGENVKLRQPLVIVEAMKMENEVQSPMDGVVGKILVEPGQQVGFGEKLIELVPLSGAG